MGITQTKKEIEMSRRSGSVYVMQDGRKVIVYNDQELMKTTNTVIINLIDDNYNLIRDDVTKKPKILLRKIGDFKDVQATWKFIGFVD